MPKIKHSTTTLSSLQELLNGLIHLAPPTTKLLYLVVLQNLDLWRLAATPANGVAPTMAAATASHREVVEWFHKHMGLPRLHPSPTVPPKMETRQNCPTIANKQIAEAELILGKITGVSPTWDPLILILTKQNKLLHVEPVLYDLCDSHHRIVLHLVNYDPGFSTALRKLRHLLTKPKPKTVPAQKHPNLNSPNSPVPADTSPADTEDHDKPEDNPGVDLSW